MKKKLKLTFNFELKIINFSFNIYTFWMDLGAYFKGIFYILKYTSLCVFFFVNFYSGYRFLRIYWSLRWIPCSFSNISLPEKKSFQAYVHFIICSRFIG